MRSRYDVVDFVEYEEDVYDRDLRQKYRRRPRWRRSVGREAIIRVNPELVTTRTMLTDHRLQ